MTARKDVLCVLGLAALGIHAHATHGWAGVAVVAGTFLVTAMVIETYLRR